jgi:hypothetical protein
MGMVHRRGRSATGWCVIAAGVIALSAVAERAEAVEATTFCGNNTAASKNASVWKALRTFEVMTINNGTSMDRNCKGCHLSTSTWPGPYIQGAFEADILREWVKSSYWVPGESKAYSAYRRIALGLMPPGNAMSLEAELTALKDAIYTWYNVQFPACGTTADSNCLWGSLRVTDASDSSIQRCSWTGQ